MTPHYEIVCVLDTGKLIDSLSFERNYRTSSGAPLPPGIYVVIWPADVDAPVYDERASYMGPYPLHLHAKMILQRHLDSLRRDPSSVGNDRANH